MHRHSPLQDLEKQLVEIHLPSKTVVVINARDMVDLIARSTHGLPQIVRALDLSKLLPLVFRVPLAWIYTHRSPVSDGQGPTHEDYAIWSEIQARKAFQANPVTLHLTGIAEEEPAPQQRELTKEELVTEIRSGVRRAQELLASGHLMRAQCLLGDLELALRPASKPTDDGWGHTTQDASVEELLREGAAAAEGTDKHEQVIQQLLGEDNAKGAVEMLLKALKEQGHHIRQLQQGRIDDLKRLHELGEWLNHEASLNQEGPVLQQVLMTFGLQLSRIGIAPKVCPACQPR